MIAFLALSHLFHFVNQDPILRQSMNGFWPVHVAQHLTSV